jgi:hypothetical protein
MRATSKIPEVREPGDREERGAEICHDLIVFQSN